MKEHSRFITLTEIMVTGDAVVKASGEKPTKEITAKGDVTINVDKVIRFQSEVAGVTKIYLDDAFDPLLVAGDYEQVYQYITGRVFLK